MVHHNRKNTRLADYDYSREGGYFITICTQDRKCTLSRIVNKSESESASIEYTQLGMIADQELHQVVQQYGITLDCYVVMPNHIHLIVLLDKTDEKRISLGRFVGAYKSIVANEWLRICRELGVVAGKIWQRNYYEHIIRNEQDYQEKRRYIESNPDKWLMDEEYVKS